MKNILPLIAALLLTVFTYGQKATTKLPKLKNPVYLRMQISGATFLAAGTGLFISNMTYLIVKRDYSQPKALNPIIGMSAGAGASLAVGTVLMVLGHQEKELYSRNHTALYLKVDNTGAGFSLRF